MYFTYVLLSKKDNKFYIGYTDNLIGRIKEHKKGKVKSTKYRLPVILIYYECCINKFDAIKRERFLKSGMGRRYLKNRLKNYLKEKASASYKFS
ncbi:MAG: excinuclease ABC subunit C [Candidatus Buchananbacteria bacterium RBG_13_36_9]|uniref:Excinuclease ABC subunit C n=1 Tax=Candidatus Buchananbacteria bacterium RBG_13_36_9 TaxID=1797530 RepID=A0A1G1XPZ2_9BACT|nr:MAG: excinuclease ABC subunit C [Candidatus Buchananbacteria bacterium RBG_13_36_9]